MLDLLTTVVGGHRVHVVATDRMDGDMHPEHVDATDLARRQRALTGTKWSMLDQVHAAEVVDVDATNATFPVGDVALTAVGGTPVAVWAADCAPIALIGSDGAIAVVHAGWRGLRADVIGAGVNAVTAGGAEVFRAVLGPVIHPCCYEFGSLALSEVATAIGASVGDISGTTAWHTPALDVPGAVRHDLARHGVELDVVGPCTGCDYRWYSHRRRADSGRHAVVVWSERA